MICLNLFLSVFVRCKCSVFFLIKQHLKKQSRDTVQFTLPKASKTFYNPGHSTSPNTRRSPSLHALFLSVTFLPEQRSLLQYTDPPPDTILSNLAAVPENSMLPAPETLQNSVPVQRTSTEPLPEPLTWNAASFAFSCFISTLPAPDTKNSTLSAFILSTLKLPLP